MISATDGVTKYQCSILWGYSNHILSIQAILFDKLDNLQKLATCLFPFFACKLKLCIFFKSGYNNLATHCNFQNIVIIIVLSTLFERTSLKKALLGLDIIQKQHHEIFFRSMWNDTIHWSTFMSIRGMVSKKSGCGQQMNKQTEKQICRQKDRRTDSPPKSLTQLTFQEVETRW